MGGEQEKKCLRCGSPGLGSKEIICDSCGAEILSDIKNGIVSFCRKCKGSKPLSANETAIFLKFSGLERTFDPTKQKAVLVIDSCPVCHQEGDSTLGQLAKLTPMPTA